MTRFTPTRFVLPLKDYPVVEVSRYLPDRHSFFQPGIYTRFESCVESKSSLIVLAKYPTSSCLKSDSATKALNGAIRFGMKYVAARTPDLETV